MTGRRWATRYGHRLHDVSQVDCDNFGFIDFGSAYGSRAMQPALRFFWFDQLRQPDDLLICRN